MKKSLVALAAFALAGVASAQSSVTLFGVVDASIAGDYNKIRNTTPVTLQQLLTPGFQYTDTIKYSQTRLDSNNLNSSRLGFRGTEDLGGGLAAAFWLEAPVANDDGSSGVASFGRRSTVSLLGAFGEVRLGRDYKPTYNNLGIFDPFEGNGAGTSVVATSWFPLEAGGNVRASNTVAYYTPKNLGGFFGEAMYGFSEKTRVSDGIFTPATGALADSRSGRYIGARIGYTNGPIDVAAAYGVTTNASNFQAGSTNKAKDWNVGASYDFNVVKVLGFVGRIRNTLDFDPSNAGVGGTTNNTGYILGVTVPVGPGLIRAAYSHVKVGNSGSFLPTRNDIGLFGGTPEPKADNFALGYVHNLSKRTALYATVAYIKNKNGANYTVHESPSLTTLPTLPGQVFEGKNSVGYDIGVRHAF